MTSHEAHRTTETTKIREGGNLATSPDPVHHGWSVDAELKRERLTVVRPNDGTIDIESIPGWLRRKS